MHIFLDPTALREYLEGFGLWAPAVFVLLQLLQVVVSPIPGNIITVAGGVMFGFWKCFLLSSVTIIIGSLLCFGIGRRLGRTALRKLLKPARFDRYESFVSKDKNRARTYMVLFLAMLFPFIPDDLLCLLAGITSIRFRTFALMILFTRPWGLLVSALLGAHGGDFPLEVIIALTVVCGVLAFFAIRYAEPLETWLLRLIHRLARHLPKRRARKTRP